MCHRIFIIITKQYLTETIVTGMNCFKMRNIGHITCLNQSCETNSTGKLNNFTGDDFHYLEEVSDNQKNSLLSLTTWMIMNKS